MNASLAVKKQIQDGIGVFVCGFGCFCSVMPRKGSVDVPSVCGPKLPRGPGGERHHEVSTKSSEEAVERSSSNVKSQTTRIQPWPMPECGSRGRVRSNLSRTRRCYEVGSRPSSSAPRRRPNLSDRTSQETCREGAARRSKKQRPSWPKQRHTWSWKKSLRAKGKIASGVLRQETNGADQSPPATVLGRFCSRIGAVGGVQDLLREREQLKSELAGQVSTPHEEGPPRKARFVSFFSRFDVNLERNGIGELSRPIEVDGDPH